MKISFLMPHIGLCGGVRRIVEICNELVRRGHEVYYFHSDGGPCTWTTMLATVMPERKFAGFDHDYAAYAFHEQCDLFHRARARHRFAYNLNLYNKWLLLVPTFLGGILRKHSFQMNRAYWIRRSVRDRNVTLMVNCTDSRDWLKRWLGVDSVAVLGAVDERIFRPLPVAKDPNTFKILCLGSHKEWKGTDTIEAAIRLVQAVRPDVMLEKFYGKGIPYERMGEVYSAADLLVDGQYYAGWNNPIAEAMACRVPVVCTTIGPNRDIAVDGETALLVKPGRPRAMARAILRLMDDPVLRRSLVERAYRTIRPYTWPYTTTEFLRVLTAHA
jgi:glycosyltransferase involved in cell wall biosynthesis